MIEWASAEGVELPAWATDPASGLLQARRVKDRAGILPDRIAFDLGTYTGTPAERALLELLMNRDIGSPEARIQQIKQHEELAERAAKIEARLDSDGGASITGMAEIARLELAAYQLAARQPLVRDKTLQDSKRNPRGSRRPLLDDWLDKQLKMRPSANNDWLWGELPDSLTGDDLYRDGDILVEVDSKLTRSGFDKRVTSARKRAGIDSRPGLKRRG